MTALPWPTITTWIPEQDDGGAVISATIETFKAAGYTDIDIQRGAYLIGTRPAAQPPAPPWWEIATPGAELAVVGDPTPVYLGPGGAAWTRAPLRPGAAGIQFWGWSGEWIRILKDSPPLFAAGLWVRAGDVRLG